MKAIKRMLIAKTKILLKNRKSGAIFWVKPDKVRVFINVGMVLISAVLTGLGWGPLFAQEEVKKIVLLTSSALTPKVSDSELIAAIDSKLSSALAKEGGDIIELKKDFFLKKEEVPIFFEGLKRLLVEETDVRIGERNIPYGEVAVLLKAGWMIIPFIKEAGLVEMPGREGSSRYKFRLALELYLICLKAEPALTKRELVALGLAPSGPESLEKALGSLEELLVDEFAFLAVASPLNTLLKLFANDAYFSYQKEEGIGLGDEFEVYEEGLSESGELKTIPKALLRVKGFTGNIAQADILLVFGELKVGDKLRPLKRLGLELAPYALVTIPWRGEGVCFIESGVRLTLAKAVTSLRPMIAIEGLIYPFELLSEDFCLRLLGGAELLINWGWLQVSAQAWVGLEKVFGFQAGSLSQEVLFTVRGIIEIAFLLSYHLKLFLDFGYEYWFGLRQGFLLGSGIVFKL